jgi:tetratricopeptide (TPR) repeat protein
MKRWFRGFALLAAVSSGWGAEPRGEYNAGRQDYLAGRFKEAVRHFRSAVQADPADAESYYWLGKSYEILADTGSPFRGAGASAKAYACLAKALELAPERARYRRELFDLLMDEADYSTAPLRKASALLEALTEADAGRAEMQWRLDAEYEERPANHRKPGFFFLSLPRRIDRAAEGVATCGSCSCSRR